jgi:hypothetical protein
LRCDCHGEKLLLASHGGEGRMRLDVTSVIGTYGSGILDWSNCLVFPLVGKTSSVAHPYMHSVAHGWCSTESSPQK